MSNAISPQDLASLTPDERRALLARLLKEKASQKAPAKTDAYPLSFAQQRLWFLDKLQPNSSAYNVCRAFWLAGELDTAALEQALQFLIGRHQTLRTTFHESEDGRPFHKVALETTPAFSAVDLRAVPDPKTEAIHQMNLEAGQPFNLSSGPLFRSFLWQTAQGEYLFLVVMHHIISDAWSLSVLFSELSAFYSAELNNRSAALPPPAVQYADFARQQRQRLRGEELERHLAFWRNYLSGRQQLLELPADRPRPSAQRFQGRDLAINLPKSLADDIRALSRKQKTTPYTTLLAAFNMLLARYSGSEDIVIGSPSANRNETGIQQLIGFFVNVLPVRTDLSGNLTFTDFLGRVHRRLVGTLAHQELPFERLVEEIQPQRDLSRHPVFQVVFAMQNVPDDKPQLPGLTAVPQSIPVRTAKFDLTLFLEEKAGGGYAGTIEYDTDLFEADTIACFASHFQTLLANVVANPEKRLSDFSMLPEREYQQLVLGWNQTKRAFSSVRLVHQLVEEQALKRPEKTAVVSFKSATQVEYQLTYEQLNRRASQMAHLLKRLGVGPERPVGVCMSRSAEMVVALLGVLKTGGAYLPLDPVYPSERLAFMLQDAGHVCDSAVPILITQPWLAGQMPGDGVEHICLDSGWETIAAEPDDNLDAAVSAENLAYIIYTSGTTGRPKGIQIEQRTLLNLIYWHRRAFEVTGQDRATQLAGPAFDASVWELWPYLTAGATIYIPDDETRLLPWQMRDWLVDQEITISFLPTPLAEAAVVLDWPRETALRKLLTGGDKLTRFPPHGLPFDLINNYGPTENTVVTTSERTLPAGDPVDLPPIGRPISNVQVYITDKNLNPVPVGVPGELLVGGESLARGYLNRPDLTAAAFIPNPFHPEKGQRLYRTGDLAKYLPDGRIAFLGRIDHQVKIRGFRIELGEIEAALLQQAAVSEALALAVEDGAGEKRLVGYLILDEDAKLETEALRQFLRERLPDYMVPVVFISLREWPLTPNGKVDRQALPVPDWGALGQNRTYTAPRNSAEEKLAAIWKNVLRVERVGVHDNFFELGGDSILSIQILARANQAGFNLTTRHLFQHQTIATLAANIQDGAGQVIEAEQGPAAGDVPLTPIQQWFFEQKLADQNHWNMAMVLETRPKLSPEALARTFGILADHHDALRLRYEQADGGFRQYYVNKDDGGNNLFSYVNLEALSEDERHEVYQDSAEKAQSSLNLRNGPLIRAAYFDYGEGKNGRLLIVIHHLVVDGVSWRILLEDLHNVYEQIVKERPVQLPDKTVSFQQWANALTDYAQSDGISAEHAYWLKRPWEAVRPLPVDFIKSASNTVGTAETIFTLLPKQETETLLQNVPPAYGAQINDILLTALAQTFGEWSGSPALLVDLEGHGREPLGNIVLDTSRTVGWFTTMYPVVLESDREGEVTGNVLSIREQMSQIPGKGIGYGLLRYLAPESDSGRKLRNLPQAEVSFNYLGQYDNLLPPDSPFQLNLDDAGPARSQGSERKHLLNINARVINGRLEVSWTYNRNHYKVATISRLAERYQANLQRLIEERPINGVPRKVYEELRQTAANRTIEAILPPGPGQAAMIAHSQNHPGSSAYFLQWVYEIDGELDSAAFRQAWSFVIGRHQLLRTLFVRAENEEDYQVVLGEPIVNWREVDWKLVADEEREEKLAALLAEDRERGFWPSVEPPIRFMVIQFGRTNYRFIWSHHHALLDGWSMAPLWQEVLAAYEGLRSGKAVDLPQSVPFSRYLDWVRRQPYDRARDYWRERLVGYIGGGQDGRGPLREVEIRLSVGETAALEQFAKENRLTLNTVVQGAWARTLARHRGQDVVVFGVTAAGRPSAIPGVEQIVGLMLNTLPMRVLVPDNFEDLEGLVDWLQSIQEQQAIQSQFEHVLLAQVQEWIGVGERPLFESFLRFQNYPMKQFLDGWQGSFKIRIRQFFDQWQYPMSVVVIPERKLILRIGYDGGLYTDEEAEALLKDFQQFVTRL